MADWHDVMEARHNAAHTQVGLESFAGRLEDAGGNTDAFAVALAALAVVSELRALSTMLDYAIGDAVARKGE